MLFKIHSAALSGLTPTTVVLEMSTAPGDKFFLVGLPDSSVRESRTRVASALLNSGYHVPRMQITVNFAPADVRKEGTGYDLPLAMGFLALGGIVSSESFAGTLMLGELGLDGAVRPIRGILPIAIQARKEGFTTLIVPEENGREAAVVEGLCVYAVNHLSQVVDILNDRPPISPVQSAVPGDLQSEAEMYPIDFADVKGQQNVKRALEVAAAGGHNVLLIGSPGCGKSMMAKRLPTILPPLTREESLEVTKIHSVAGKLGGNVSLITRRPFRSPHHTISDVALIGGGTSLQPGEISLAHNGVLFLDELPEFSRTALETMRQPLEDRQIHISRTKYSATLPCSFMLVASMNPCPCGYYNHPTRRCTCSPGQRQRYIGKISGPLLDRIDLQVEVMPVALDDLSAAPQGESSSTIRQRVIRAREVQTARFREEGIHCNAQMSARQLNRYAIATPQALDRLSAYMKRLDLSARAYERVLKVARTIADLAGSPRVEVAHIAEAVSYRNLDRSSWVEGY